MNSFDMLFQIKKSLIYKRNLDFCEKGQNGWLS